MKKISLSLTAHYARQWGAWEGIRELVQNWHDGLYEARKETAESQSHSQPGVVFTQEKSDNRFQVYKASLKTELDPSPCLGHIVLDKLMSKLYLINKHTSLHKRILLLGYSKKALTSNVIGQFGEGLKIGALALVRQGRLVTMETSEETWRFDLCNEENFGEKVLTVLVSERESSSPLTADYRAEGADFPVAIESPDTVTTVFIDNKEWQEFKHRFLFLHPPIDEVQTEIGSLLLDEGYSGQLYVKGVWVSDLSKEDLSTGVNFVNLRIDRDRNAVPRPSEIDHMVSCMWVKAVEMRPSLVNTYFTMLQNEKFRDVRQVLQYASDNLAAIVAEEFSRIHGEGVFAVSSSSTQADLNQVMTQLKKQVVLCNDTLLKLLHQSGRFRTLEEELQDITPRQWGIVPIQNLPAYERSVFDHSVGLLQLGYPQFTPSFVDITEAPKLAGTESCVECGDRIQIPSWMLKTQPVEHIRPCTSQNDKLHQCMCREARIVCSMSTILEKREPMIGVDLFTDMPQTCYHRLLRILSPLATQVHSNTSKSFCYDLHTMSPIQENDHTLCLAREQTLREELNKVKETLSEAANTHKISLEKFKKQLEKTEKDLIARETEAINTEHSLQDKFERTIGQKYTNKIQGLDNTIQRLKMDKVQMGQELDCLKSKFKTESIQKLCSEQLSQEELTSETKDKLQLLMSLSEIISEDLQRDKFLCTVCLIKRKEVLVTPCSHYTMCGGCADQIIGTTRQCPVCKTGILSTTKVYG